MKYHRVAAIIFNTNNEILFGQGSREELWTIGGGIEAGENHISCLQRELQEEVCVQLIHAEYIGEFIGPSPYNKEYITHNHTYICTIQGIAKPSNEIHKIIWIEKQKFLQKEYPMISTNNDILQHLIVNNIW